jgi:hydrogenase maturation protease
MIVFELLLGPRILVMGLGDPSLGDEGIGVYLARALRVALKEVEVEEMPAGGPDYLRIFHDYDVVILIDSISMCRGVGTVTLVSPYALADLKGAWVEHARGLERAIHESRVLGHRVPTIHIVAVCVPDVEATAKQPTPGKAALYRAVVARVRDMVKELVRDARDSSVVAPAHRT